MKAARVYLDTALAEQTHHALPDSALERPVCGSLRARRLVLDGVGAFVGFAEAAPVGGPAVAESAAEARRAGY